jgi:hypothetical protein
VDVSIFWIISLCVGLPVCRCDGNETGKLTINVEYKERLLEDDVNTSNHIGLLYEIHFTVNAVIYVFNTVICVFLLLCLCILIVC